MSSKKRADDGTGDDGVETKRARGGEGEEQNPELPLSQQQEQLVAEQQQQQQQRQEEGEEEVSIPQRRQTHQHSTWRGANWLSFSGRRRPRVGNEFQVVNLPSPSDNTTQEEEEEE